MQTYKITLRHDRGTTHFLIRSRRLTQAVRELLNHERAPFRAIRRIRRLSDV